MLILSRQPEKLSFVTENVVREWKMSAFIYGIFVDSSTSNQHKGLINETNSCRSGWEEEKTNV